MDQMEGTIDKNSGEILLQFKSKFILRIGGMLKFTELIIQTLLKTGKVKSKLHKAKSINLKQNGLTKLLGISLVPKTGNKILDTFLGLPNEARAKLNCKIK